jgi:CHAT domain-containing protein/Tfp pilus assembly protein PilF
MKTAATVVSKWAASALCCSLLALAAGRPAAARQTGQPAPNVEQANKYAQETQELFEAGKLPEARAKALLALDIFRKAKLREQEGLILSAIAATYFSADPPMLAEAADFYEQSLEIARGLPDPRPQASVRHVLSRIYLLQGGQGMLSPWDRTPEQRRALEKSVEHASLSLKVFRQVQGAESLSGQLLYVLAMAHHGLGNIQEAKRFLQEGLAVAEGLKDWWSVGTVQYNLGVMAEDEGSKRQALQLYQQALESYSKVPAAQRDDDFFKEAFLLDRAYILHLTGNVQRELALVTEAAASFKEELDIRLSVKDDEGAQEARESVRDCYLQLGQREEAAKYAEPVAAAQPPKDGGAGPDWFNSAAGQGALNELRNKPSLDRILWESILKEARKVGDRPAVARASGDLGVVEVKAGNYEKAIPLLTEARELNASLNNPDAEANNRNGLGAVYTALGEYDKALAEFEAALGIYEHLGNRSGQGDSLNHIAQLQDMRGNYAEAVLAVQKAGDLWHALGDRRKEALAWANLAAMYDHMGRTNLALTLYEKALPIREDFGDLREEEVILSNLGLTHAELGDPAKGETLLRQALGIAVKAEDLEGQTQALNNLGGIYARQRKYPEALDSYREASALAARLRNPELLAVLQANEADIGLRSGDAAGSLGKSQQALETAQAAGLPVLAGEIHFGIGLALERLGRDEEALDSYYKAIETKEAIREAGRIEDFKIALAAEAADVYDRAIKLHLKRGEDERAFDLTERARARTFLDQLGADRPDLRRGADAQLVQKEHDLLGRISALEQSIARSRDGGAALQSQREQLAALRREYEDVLERLKLNSPAYASMRAVRPLTLAELRPHLDAGTTLLSYFVMDDETVAFVVTRDSPVETFRLHVKESELAAKVGWLRRFTNLRDPRPRTLRDLYDLLVAPLWGSLHTGGTLGIIPHGVLHYLPFAALNDGRRALVDDFTLFHLPSASVLPFVQRKARPAGGPMLALAQSRADGLPLLRHADEEARQVALLYSASALLTPQATKADFIARAPSSGLLHLAAHGELNTDSPLFSRIVLGPGADGDRSLYVRDVYELDLSKTSLVVLSACETQLGTRSRGDDIVGLNRAFIDAGVPTVVASLWTVDDEATGFLMQSFYRHLRSGLGKARALRLAQLETRAKYLHPYYWAPFVLTGQP